MIVTGYGDRLLLKKDHDADEGEFVTKLLMLLLRSLKAAPLGILH